MPSKKKTLPANACWGITISPFPKDLEQALTKQYNSQKSIKWWAGVVENNGENGIIHCHLGVVYTTRVTREAVMKTIWKHCLACHAGTIGKLTKAGIEIKVWYNDDWVTNYPQGREIGHAVSTLPTDLDYLPKGDESMKRPEKTRQTHPSLHDKILAFWDRDMGKDSTPCDKEDVNMYLKYLQFQSLEIGVIDNYKYNGRVIEMYNFICYSKGKCLLTKVKTSTSVPEVMNSQGVGSWEVGDNQDAPTSYEETNPKNSENEVGTSQKSAPPLPKVYKEITHMVSQNCRDPRCLCAQKLQYNICNKIDNIYEGCCQDCVERSHGTFVKKYRDFNVKRILRGGSSCENLRWMMPLHSTPVVSSNS